MEKVSPSGLPTADMNQKSGVTDEKKNKQQGNPSGEPCHRRLVQVLSQGMGWVRMEVDFQQPAGKQYAEKENVTGANSASQCMNEIYFVLRIAEIVASSLIQNEFASRGSLATRMPWIKFWWSILTRYS